MQQKLYREELLQIFPQKLRQRIEESVTFKNLTEIRLRADLPVLIETTQENYFLKKEEAAEKRRAIAKEEDNWILSPEQLKLIFEKITNAENEIKALCGKLDALSPLKVLKRGYAFVSDENGTAIKNADDVKINDVINVRLCGGRLLCDVREVSNE